MARRLCRAFARAQSLSPLGQFQPRTGLMLLAAALANAFAVDAGAQETATVLPQVTVKGEAIKERADGPVEGYRATRSATFTRTDTPIEEVPASVTVVPENLMKDQAMQGMADVLRYVPGASVHQGEGNRDQVVLRGISTTADFYVDGVRDDAQVFRDLYNLERVEVLKGAGGMIFGRGGAGGVVNRVTKKPMFERVSEAELTLGSYSQRRGTVDVGNKISDSAAWRLNAMAETADSFRQGFDLKRYAINPTVTLLPGAQTAITLGYEHLNDERTADRGIPSRNGQPFDTDPSRFFGNAGQSEARSTVDSFSAVVDHDIGAGVHLRNSLRIAHYDKFYQNVYPGSAVDGAGNMRIAAYNNANDRTNIFNQTDLTAKITTGGIEHTLLAGVELGRQVSANKRNTGFFGGATTATVSAANPIATATRFAPAASDADNEVTANIGAVYVQDQIALTKQWKVLAGLRYDRFAVEFDDRRANSTDLARTDNAWSPRLGVIWEPNPASTYYASYSYAFLPSAEQLSLAVNTADLAPEKAKNYEVGARWNLQPKLTLSAAVFRLDRDDVRVSDPLNPGFFVKTGQQRTEGWELGLQGDVTRNWQVFGGYAKLDGRIVSPIASGSTVVPAGSRIGLVPEQAFSLWNKIGLGERWAAGLGIIHQSSVYTSFTNTVKLPAFTRTDGALYYTLPGGKTRLSLFVENLFNRKYYSTADGDNNISPGAPRNLRVVLATSF